MSWWGKLVGGALGFAIGGPLGAILGATVGHNFDRPEGSGAATLEGPERTQTAFFTATFSVMGHMAKADGKVTQDEIQMAGRVMEQMGLDEALRHFARQLFSAGKADDFPLDAVLQQLRSETRSRNLLRMFLEIQVYAAYADTRMHPQEKRLLEHLCVQLGFPSSTLSQIESLVEAELNNAGMETAGSSAAALADAYQLLGINTDCTDAELKRAYRRLMSQHHPDKLVAQGLPEEMMKLATAKTQEIKAAYERVREARGRS